MKSAADEEGANYSLIVFDLDGTLAESKVPISLTMAELLLRLLDKCQVAVISGAAFERMQVQLIDQLHATPPQLTHLHILPTNGTHYYRYDLDSTAWQEIYAADIRTDEKQRIAKILESTARKLGLWENQTWGPIIEDRGSQITFSALGQNAPLKSKQAWDPDGSKKRQLRDALEPLLPGYEVRTAGLTSEDVTVHGMDKASAVGKLKDVLGLRQADVIYVGDALAPGGNDAVVLEAGFRTVGVTGPEETAATIRRLLNQ